MITEITDGSQDQFELQNVTAGPANITGWYVKISDGNTNINAVNPLQLNLPAGMPAGALLWCSEATGAPRVWWGGPINWSATGSPSRGWIMLFDATHSLRDFLIWGWSAAQLNSLNLTINGVNLSGAAITAAGQWSGNPVTTPGSNIISVIKRIGPGDTNTAADFTNTTTGANFNATNPNLAIPWSFSTPVTVVPSSINLAGGIGIAYLSVPTAGEGLTLRAADPVTGQSGQSPAIDITAALADTDGDGMPDAWESSNGLNPIVQDAALDRDGDGFSNLQEFALGTAANNSASAFHATGPALGAADATLTWQAVAGRIYQIESSPKLDGPWNRHLPPRLATTTGPMTHTIPTEGAPRLFLRVVHQR